MRIGSGTTIRWHSQTGGRMKVKVGRVVAFVPAEIDLFTLDLLPHDMPKWRFKLNQASSVDRYLVRVSGEDGDFYYAPFARNVEQQNPDARREGEDKLDVSFDPGKGEISTNKVKRIRTPEELFEHAGLDPSEWAIAKDGLTINSYEMNAGEGVVMPLFQIKMRITPIREGKLIAERKEEMLREIRAEVAGRYPVIYRPGHGTPTEHESMFELCIFDAHLGSLVWGRESGEPYDLEIAEATYTDAFRRLVDRAAAHNPERILFPIGQDLFHTDILIDGKGGATHKGTPQDVDSRWQKGFMAARRLISRLVQDVVRDIAPVDIVVTPGNHDTQKSFYLGEVIDATFFQHPHVRIDNRPVRRKYYHYGANLLGFTHGDQERGRSLAMLMAQEARGAWGNTTFREWHMGHLHKEWCDEEMGVRSRIMPALCPADAWHSQKGFVQNIRGARGYLWRRSGGIEAIFPYEIPPSAEHLANIAPLLRGDA